MEYSLVLEHHVGQGINEKRQGEDDARFGGRRGAGRFDFDPAIKSTGNAYKPALMVLTY